MSHANDHDRTFKLDELAREAGVAPRTVRYYVQRGLLPAPVFRGRDTAYGAEHLERLRAIRRLQERYLPLDAIQVELERLSAAELRRLAAADEAGALPGRLPAPRVPAPPAPPGPRDRGTLHVPLERWTRLRISPGLEIHVADGCAAPLRRIADELARYGAELLGEGGTT